MSDGVDWIESEGTLVFDGARLAWTPDNATFSGKPVSFRLLDVASIDGGGDKLTLKLKNGERHRFRVPSGKGWATHLRAAQ